MTKNKNTISTLMFLLCVSQFAVAEVDLNKDFKFKPQFRIRTEGNERTDYSSNRDFTSLRVRPEIYWTSNQHFSFVFTPQFSRILGDQVPTFASNAATPPAVPTTASGGTTDPNINVHEAYVDYQPSDVFYIRGGRQTLAYGDELILGASDWNNAARSFDAFKSHCIYSLGTASAYSDIFASKIVDNNTVATNYGGDIDFYGLYNSFNFGNYFKAVDFYGFWKHDASLSPAYAEGSSKNANNLGAVGIRATSQFHGYSYRIEAVRETGNAVSSGTGAYMLDAEAGYTFDMNFKPSLSGEYFVAGRNYNQLYPTTHKWLGIADVVGQRNIRSTAIHAKSTLNQKLNAKLDFYSFKRAELSAPAYKKADTTKTIGTASASNSTAVGSEYDLSLSYRLSDPVTISGGIARFQSGSYFTDQFPKANPSFFYLQLEAKL